MITGIRSFDLPRDELCRKLGGGFPPGSIIVIEGGSGSGKSTVCQRLAYGLMENGSTVTYFNPAYNKGFHQPDVFAQLQYRQLPVKKAASLYPCPFTDGPLCAKTGFH
ncbi:MAG: hypothetical protein ABIH80_03990 [Methanobacteriota archaeon]